MTRVIRRERIPSTDPRLGRSVCHDSESRRYRFPTAGLTPASVRHERRIPVLDQGQLGSCTGNAGIGALGTDPLYATVASTLMLHGGTPTAEQAEQLKAAFLGKTRTPDVMLLPKGAEVTWTAPPHYPLTEAGAVQLYSDATRIDDAPGQYPPDDTGSSGLAIAKVLKAHDQIAGYQHTFSLDAALKALTLYPLMVGSVWLNSMFTPGPDGLLTVDFASGVAGGHEYDVDEYDEVRGWVGMTNSWAESWGLKGRAYMEVEAFGRLLDQQGDVIVLLPLTQPAPIPSPAPDQDRDDLALAAVARPWVRRHHTTIAGNAGMQAALKTWLAAKGL